MGPYRDKVGIKSTESCPASASFYIHTPVVGLAYTLRVVCSRNAPASLLLIVAWRTVVKSRHSDLEGLDDGGQE